MGKHTATLVSKAAEKPRLQPGLQNVLACLDVALDAELMRYRQQRQRQDQRRPAQLSQDSASPLNLVTLKAPFSSRPKPAPLPVQAATVAPIQTSEDQVSGAELPRPEVQSSAQPEDVRYPQTGAAQPTDGDSATAQPLASEPVSMAAESQLPPDLEAEFAAQAAPQLKDPRLLAELTQTSAATTAPEPLSAEAELDLATLSPLPPPPPAAVPPASRMPVPDSPDLPSSTNAAVTNQSAFESALTGAIGIEVSSVAQDFVTAPESFKSNGPGWSHLESDPEAPPITGDEIEGLPDLDHLADFNIPNGQLPPLDQRDVAIATPHQTEPDDYLASSEALLRSLEQEDPEPTHADDMPEFTDLYEERWLNRVLSPLGMGVLVLLLAISATLGYLFLNPGVVTAWRSQSESDTEQLDESTNADATEAESDGLDNLISAATEPNGDGETDLAGPDLTSQEFVDVNLDTLSTLQKSEPNAETFDQTPIVASQTPVEPTRPKPSLLSGLRGSVESPRPQAAAPAPTLPPATTPTLKPNTKPQPIPTDNQFSTALPQPPAPTQPSLPEPAASVPTTTPVAPVQPDVTASVSPVVDSGSESYRVVVPYTSDRALDQAQNAVPDAFVRNFDNGAKIQFGTFGDTGSAEALVDELRQQGIEAQVESR